MTAFSDSLENAFLLHYFNNSAIANVGDAGGLLPSATAGSVYVTLHTADPGEAGAQNTSVAAYTGFVYKAVARSSAQWTVSGNQVSNVNAITFAQSSSSETEMFWGIGRSSSGAGTLDFKGHIGAAVKTFTANAADVTADTITCPSHGYTTDDRVVFYATMGSTLPTGMTEGTVYFVLASGLTSDVFKFATTSGGAAINITAVGAGVVGKVTPLAVANLIAPEFAAGQLIIQLF